MSGRLILLDRDGVINEDSDAFVKNADEWRPIPGSLEAIARLNHKGYLPVVISNQSGIGRGLLTLDDLSAIHLRLCQSLGRVGGHLEAILFCPHAPENRCNCRKPATGLLELASLRFAQNLAGVLTVGDSWRDLLAASAAGAQGVLVRTGKGLRTLAEHPEAEELFPVFGNLAEVVDALLAEG